MQFVLLENFTPLFENAIVLLTLKGEQFTNLKRCYVFLISRFNQC